MSQTPDFSQLPADVWRLISGYFNMQEWHIFRCTCKRFRDFTPHKAYRHSVEFHTWDTYLVHYAVRCQSLSLLAWVLSQPRRVNSYYIDRKLFKRPWPSVQFLTQAIALIGKKLHRTQSDLLLGELRIQLTRAIPRELDKLPEDWENMRSYTVRVARRALRLGKEGLVISCLPYLARSEQGYLIHPACQGDLLEVLRTLNEAGERFPPGVMLEWVLQRRHPGTRVLQALEAGEFGPLAPEKLFEMMYLYQSKLIGERLVWIYQRWKYYVNAAWDYKYYRRYLAHLVSEKGKSGSSERAVPEAALFEELPFSDEL